MNLLEIDQNSVAYTEAWVRNSWPTLAAAAYGHYLSSGRGALVIDLLNAMPTDDFILGRRAALGFLTIEAIAAHGIKLQELYQMATKYDPETEGVMFIARQGSPLSLQVSGGITPVEAHEQYQLSARAVPFLGPARFG